MYAIRSGNSGVPSNLRSCSLTIRRIRSEGRTCGRRRGTCPRSGRSRAGQEELEVLLLAVVRRGRHQQQVPGEPRQELAQAVALGVLDLAAEEGGRHLVGLVEDDQIPVGLLQLRLHVLVAAELVEPDDDSGFSSNRLPVPGRFERVVGQDLEGELERRCSSSCHCSTRLPGADDQQRLQSPADDQFLDGSPAMIVLPAPGSSARR